MVGALTEEVEDSGPVAAGAEEPFFGTVAAAAGSYLVASQSRHSSEEI